MLSCQLLDLKAYPLVLSSSSAETNKESSVSDNKISSYKPDTYK